MDLCRRRHEEPPLEGLTLLKKLWDQIDAINASAQRCKRLAIVLFLLQLTLPLIMIVLSVLSPESISHAAWKYIVLALSICFCCLVAFDAILQPKVIWRKLEVEAVFLESMIWKYRMRVGISDLALTESLEAWKEKSNTYNRFLMKDVDDIVHKSSDSVIEDQGMKDDHFSYLTDHQYLHMRGEQVRKKYQKCIPKFTAQKHALLIISIGIMIASLAPQDGESNKILSNELIKNIVIISTVVLVQVKAWCEFMGIPGKYHLFADAISQIKTLKEYWERTSRLQRTKENKVVVVNGIEELVIRVSENLSTCAFYKCASKEVGGGDAI